MSQRRHPGVVTIDKQHLIEFRIVRARLIDDWITNNNGTDSIVAVLSKFGDGWRERLCLVAEDIESKASDAWATEQARKELEDVR